MGRDKALLPTRAGTLMQEIARKALAAAGNVALVGHPARYGHFGFDCLPDVHAGFGPLGGIYTALASGRGEYNLILACDMPQLDELVLQRLFATAESTDVRCVAAHDADGRVHPLCAVYRRDALAAVAQAHSDKRLCLMDLLQELGGVRMRVDEPLTNCNTPEQWAAVLRS